LAEKILKKRIKAKKTLLLKEKDKNKIKGLNSKK